MPRFTTGSGGGTYMPKVEGSSGGTVTADLMGSIEGLWGCPASVSVGDLVQISGEQFVEKSNVSSPGEEHIIGFVTRKPTGSSCVVRYSGEVTLNGLSSGEDYFASEALGQISTVPSSTGYIQQVGRAKSDTVLVVSIHKRVIIT
tara:strand:- start:2234 stop:2668 length:435 start_codon:yes stop_codon:yes gene_type:complete